MGDAERPRERPLRFGGPGAPRAQAAWLPACRGDAICLAGSLLRPPPLPPMVLVLNVCQGLTHLVGPCRARHSAGYSSGALVSMGETQPHPAGPCSWCSAHCTLNAQDEGSGDGGSQGAGGGVGGVRHTEEGWRAAVTGDDTVWQGGHRLSHAHGWATTRSSEGVRGLRPLQTLGVGAGGLSWGLGPGGWDETLAVPGQTLTSPHSRAVGRPGDM